MSALTFIRKQIVEELVRLSNALSHDPGLTTPYQRVMVLSQLMDRLVKLDDRLKPYKPMEIRIIRVSDEPDEISLYDELPPSHDDSHAY